MKFRVTIEEQKRHMAVRANAVKEDESYWEVQDKFETSSQKVLAGILRAKADELDPPQKVTYRGTDG